MLDAIETIERASHEAWNRGDYAAVARHVLDGYGDELHAFLLASARGDAAQADDAFLQFVEDFWRGLPKFEWRASIRGWCYRIARNALSRQRRAPDNRPHRRVALSAEPLLEQLAEVVRSRTRPYLRSEVKDAFQKLREQLSDEEQALLILRIDRKLSWREVAHALLGEAEPADDAAVEKFAATLRQRLVELKSRLRRMAEEAGLLD